MKALIKLSGPIVLTLVAQITMGTVDLVAAGRVSPYAVGAVGLANAFYAWAMVFGIGLLSSLDYVVAKAFGAGEPKEGEKALTQGLILGFFASIPLTLFLILGSTQLKWLGIEPQVAELAGPCVRVMSFSLLPFFLFFGCRLYLQALGKVRAALFILLGANLLNALVNYLLVFGNFGFPELGAVGASWATLVCRIAMFGAIAVVLFQGGYRPRFEVDTAKIRELLRIGIPSAFQLIFEVGVFSVVTALAARLSAMDLAAHQIVLNIATLTFMVPLGIGSATSVLVGQAVGRRDFLSVRISGRNGLILGVGFMAVSAFALLVFPSLLIGAYTNDTSLLGYARGILFLAAIFQLSDGVQVVLTGALRGLGKTHFAMMANLFGHWTLGLPVGALLGFHYAMGLRGLWTGLALGLTSVAVAVYWKWHSEVKRLVASP